MQVCQWCQSDASAAEGSAALAPITRGLCDVCTRYLQGNPSKLAALLERFAEPILVVNSRGAIISNNGAARVILGHGMDPSAAPLVGDVVECAYARLPGGCGKTVHCDGCGIRRAFTETLRSGVSVANIDARSYHRGSAALVTVDWTLSTERLGEVVLLRMVKHER